MSGLRPYDLATWALEAAPVVLALPFLLKTHRRFPLTDLLYAGVLVYVLYLVSHVLSGGYLQEIGRFLQGVLLALAAREMLIRGQYLRDRALLPTAVVFIVLALSAGLELLEWGATHFLGQPGADPRANMLCALVGALAALLVFSRLHDLRLKRLDRFSRELEVVPLSAP
jgi:putative membrane protein